MEHLSHFSDRASVVVVGAGISGLCVGYFLKKLNIDVIVLEKDIRPGGTMKTIRDDGWLIETGPNSTLETTPLFQQIFDDLGITSQRQYANEASNNRYIVRDNLLFPLPMSPGKFLTSSLWSVSGKLRLLKEPFIGRSIKEESVAEFVERRLGREFLDYAVNPFIAGVYAGDPAKLSVRSALPKIYALEDKYGGLIKGMIRGRKERKQRAEKAKDRAKLFSFRDGMQSLPDALASYLGSSLQLNVNVEQIIPMRAGKFPVYTLSYTQDGLQKKIESQAVVLAAPAHATSHIIRPIDPVMATTLESIYYPPVAEVFLGFRLQQIKRELDGFGFLVPEIEQRKILGSIWSSTIFPHRAPEHHAAFTSFVGGSRQPELAAHSNNDLVAIVLSELRSLIGIAGDPVFTKIIRWERAIPQYHLGYEKILKSLERFEQNFRGAFFCSNFRGGISVGDCVMSAEKTAKAVKEHVSLRN